MIDGILFDKDGTLFDFRQSWSAWAHGFLASVATSPQHLEQMAAAIGYLPQTRDFHPDSPVIAGTAEEIGTRLLPLLPDLDAGSLKRLIDAAAAQVAMAEAVPLVPLFTAFRARGLKLGIATNDSEVPAQRHMAAHGLTGLLDFIAGYDSGHGAKPEPGMMHAFLAHTGLEAGRVLMVGDSLHDLDAGRAAGMPTVAVLTGIATADDLAPHADVVLADIGELLAWIDAKNRDQSPLIS